ncbi:hypothetical protein EIB18_09915 [Caulobacter vibrioides]|uniref:Uncharacterized protein n=2 Tax=Caulobacter TaxID=75 RepID=A0A0H3IXQ7_CAUVN|nr:MULTISPECIES: hypothetical protein [Caulobacter]YP_009020530.1 hypothetical protein CCNA_03958 [Caulobacter vibrioides NA1000]AHI88561.1 hypothetical protein CCNA_03958 [Caulobacter vibrioides NA1000]AVG21595.1 hypothetical protein CA608_20250 [Caulobacter vibrioides]AVH77127.1 hypothetical protein CA607_20405 [Caulobacter vibrioides]AVQ04420.1 hypothetical protein B7G68_11045 [Caulobacter segnis]AZH14806.1 hypothetical protein EIB18_09915 [Caulobacter vibrioides]
MIDAFVLARPYYRPLP